VAIDDNLQFFWLVSPKIEMKKAPRIPLGEMLVKAGVITQEQLDEALEAQKSCNDRIGEILVQLGYATEDKIFLHLARQLDIPYMSLKVQRIDAKVLNLVPVEMATEYNIIPIDKIGKFITIAMSDPLDDEVTAQVEEITGLKVQKVASTKEDIREAIERYYLTGVARDSAKENQSDSDIKLNETVYVLTQEESEEHSMAVGKSYFGSAQSVSSTLERRPKTAIVEEFFVPEYTFDNFITDDNAEALQAAIHICNAEQALYNPLLIYAERGLGKTHLLHAIGNNIIQNAPQKKVKLINCYELSLRIMNPKIYKVCAEMCGTWDSFDILLFDDFHMLCAEKSNQEVFTFIFDFLYRRKKQMVIASIPFNAVDYEIEVTLLSRIKSGLTAEIKPPNFETRLAILRKREEIEGNTQLADVDLNNIAEQTYEDVRQLFAARNRIWFQTLPLDVEEVDDVDEDTNSITDEPATEELRLATLTFTSGSRAGAVVEVAQWEASIGRSGDIQVVDPKESPISLISRKHAFLKFAPGSGKYEIEDTSKHGTAVNGELLEGGSKLLDDGDTIQLVKLGGDRYLLEMKLEYQE